VLGFKQKRLD